MQDDTSRKTLVYADIGPMSTGRIRGLRNFNVVLDDHRVEYTQVNTMPNAQPQRSQKLEREKTKHTVGMFVMLLPPLHQRCQCKTQMTF